MMAIAQNISLLFILFYSGYLCYISRQTVTFHSMKCYLPHGKR